MTQHYGQRQSMNETEATCNPANGSTSARRFGFILILLSVLAALLVLARSITYGVEMYWDSVSYISAARSLLAGNGFAEFHGGRHEYWPPLYPLMLAAGSLFVFDPRDVAAPLNAALFGLTVFVVGRWLQPRIESPFLLVWSCLAVMLSIPLASIASWALTESAFVLFATVSLFRAAGFLGAGDRSSLVWGAVFTAAASSTRYVGVVSMAVFLLAIVVRRGASPGKKVKQVALYSLIAGLPVGMWLLRNYLVVGSLTGARSLRPTPLPEVLDTVLAVMAGWALPYLPANALPATAGPPAGWASILLAATVVALIVRGIVVHRRRFFMDLRSPGPFHVLVAFALLHVGLIGASVTLTELPVGAPRHLLPAYLPLLLAGVLAAERFLVYEKERCAGRRGPGAPVVALTVMLCAWLLWSAGLNALEIRQANAGVNRALSAPAFTNSETFRYVRERGHLFSGLILANQADALHIHTDGAATYSIPAADLSGLRVQIEYVPNGAHIVWRHGAMAAFGYDASDLRTLPGLRTVAELSDGVVLQVDRSRTPVEPMLRLRSGFDVYLYDGRLTWIRKPCDRSDTEALFHLYVTPVDEKDLAAASREYGFNILDFTFDQQGGVRSDGTCRVQRALPLYPIASVFTGQWTSAEGVLWSGAFTISE